MFKYSLKLHKVHVYEEWDSIRRLRHHICSAAETSEQLPNVHPNFL
jgi:hypothetical protein